MPLSLRNALKFELIINFSASLFYISTSTNQYISLQLYDANQCISILCTEHELLPAHETTSAIHNPSSYSTSSSKCSIRWPMTFSKRLGCVDEYFSLVLLFVATAFESTLLCLLVDWSDIWNWNISIWISVERIFHINHRFEMHRFSCSSTHYSEHSAPFLENRFRDHICSSRPTQRRKMSFTTMMASWTTCQMLKIITPPIDTRQGALRDWHTHTHLDCSLFVQLWNTHWAITLTWSGQ